MKTHWLFLIFLFLITGCSTDSKITDITQFVRDDADIIIRTGNINGLSSNLKNNDFLKKISTLKNYQDIQEQLRALNLLKTDDEVLISLSKNEHDSLELFFVTKYRDSLLDFQNETNFSSEHLELNSRNFDKISINGQVVFTTVKDSFLLASSNLEKLKKLEFKTKSKVGHVVETSSGKASFSTFVKSEAFANEPFFLVDSLKISDFSQYFLVDALVSQDQILLNGITKAIDSTNFFINVFRDSKPRENHMPEITPSNADGFLSFTFENFRPFLEHINQYKTIKKFPVNDTIIANETLFDNIVEVGVIYEGPGHATVLRSLDEMTTSDALLAYQDIVEGYRGINIFKFGKPTLFKSVFYPLIPHDDFNLYCVIDNFFVFSNSKETLQNIIASYQNNTTYSNRSNFMNVKEHLSNSSSLLMAFDNTTFETILQGSSNMDLKNYNTTAIQFIYDNHFAHTNMVIQKSKTRADANTVSEEFNIKLDADALIDPQFVTNYTNNQKDIVVQDVNNNLYLISNKGEILWKKALEGPILGRMGQVDIYKNGRLQLAFSTPNRVYVLDRNGKEVNPFPLKFNDPITQPLSIFDYDNKRDYRLMITQGKNVLMYDLTGKVVKGFEFNSTNSPILTQPQHFRIGRKDYLVLKTKDRLYILDRRGNTRVSPKSTTNFSTEAVYVYNDNFTTTSESGALFSVDEKGNTSSQQINLNEQHHMDATSRTLATLTDNKLTIKSKVVELDFGLYSPPKIYYLYDKIYVTVTDLQTNKVYLFDSNGKAIQNFPIHGSSAMDMDNADGDGNLEIVVKSGSDELLMYQIN